LGERARSGERDGHRHADDPVHVVANALGRSLIIEVPTGLALPEKLVDGIVFDARAERAELIEHLAAERFVPAEVAFDVNAFGALLLGFPDRFADLDPGALHGIGAGDDAGALIAEHAEGHAAEPGAANDL